jgi:putative restriction endonuclease
LAKAVFTTRVDPTYDDLPETHYHFPDIKGYLAVAEAAIGDWIVYYEPSRRNEQIRDGRSVYFATARVTAIRPDPGKANHYYAYLQDYLEFPRPVPFKEGAHFYERTLGKPDGTTDAFAFRSAMRPISDIEYEEILRAGYAAILEPAPALPTKPGEVPSRIVPEFADEEAEFQRPIVEQLVRRPFRDRAFATGVVSAYDKTCAVTGLRIINGGGRAEVQAAHIRPVEAGGSDSIRNGLALSGTAHWMFDRGLISIDDDYTVLLAEDRLPDAAKHLVRSERKLLLPNRDDIRPHKSHLKFHRDHVFKG